MKLFIFIFCAIFCQNALSSNSYEMAQVAYQRAEKANNMPQKNELLNEALRLYQVDGETCNGKIYYNMGNCYYQLNQMGLAIWAYSKAKELMPRDERVKENLRKAFEKTGVSQKRRWVDFLFSNYLTKREKAMLTLLFAFSVALFVSIKIWSQKKILGVLCLNLFCFFFFGLGYLSSCYGAKEGVLLTPSYLRCGPGWQYKEAFSQMNCEGEKFKMLEISADEQWAFIQLDRAKKGYVPINQIRML